MRPAPGLPEPVDGASGVELPPGFAEAPERVRAAIAHRDRPGMPGHTPVAAQMTERGK